MDFGSKDGKGLRISTNCFKEEELIRLINIIKFKFSITPIIINHKHSKTLYINTSDMIILKP